MSSNNRGVHFVLSKKKNKLFLRDPVFPEGGHQAPCFILIYRRSKFVQGGPLRFWVTIDGRKLAKPLEHGDTCLIGVKPGRHIVDVKMPYTGLVNLDKKLETRELEPGEMQVIEMAICGLTIPYTKVWDLGKMHCPIAVIEKIKKKKKPAPPPEKETTTTTTTVYSTSVVPVQPQYSATTTTYAVTPTTTTTTFAPQPMPMYSGQSMYFPTAPATGPLPQGFTPLVSPMGSNYNPFMSPAPMYPTVPQTGAFAPSPMMTPQNMNGMQPMMQPMMSPMMQPMQSMPMQSAPQQGGSPFQPYPQAPTWQRT